MKENENIIHIDIEKQLQIKPDLFASNVSLPFQNESFDTVFFDPPFTWGCDKHPFFSYPNVKLRNLAYPNIVKNDSENRITQYYGIERYKTRSELAAYIYRAEREIYRILKADGCLWLRWCNMVAMEENHILSIFSNWTEMLKHEIGSAKRHSGETSSYWFLLMKKPMMFVQPELFAVACVGGKESMEAQTR